jgi:hypothetical protein
LAAARQAGMIDLYNQMVDRDLDTGVLPIGSKHANEEKTKAKDVDFS